MWFIEMLTRDLKKSNDNLVVHGKLIVNLSTNLTNASAGPGSRPGPSSSGSMAGTFPTTASSQTRPSAGASPAPSRSQTLTDPTSSSTAAVNGTGAQTNGANRTGLSSFEDNQGRLPAGWERREDNLGIIRDQRLGTDHQRRTMNEINEQQWKRTCRWNEEHIRIECCRRIELGQAHRVSRTRQGPANPAQTLFQ